MKSVRKKSPKRLSPKKKNHIRKKSSPLKTLPRSRLRSIKGGGEDDEDTHKRRAPDEVKTKLFDPRNPTVFLGNGSNILHYFSEDEGSKLSQVSADARNTFNTFVGSSCFVLRDKPKLREIISDSNIKSFCIDKDCIYYITRSSEVPDIHFDPHHDGLHNNVQ